MPLATANAVLVPSSAAEMLIAETIARLRGDVRVMTRPYEPRGDHGVRAGLGKGKARGICGDARRRRRRREHHDRVDAAGCRDVEPCGAARRLGEPAHDRKTETGAGGRLRRAPETVERLQARF